MDKINAVRSKSISLALGVSVGSETLRITRATEIAPGTPATARYSAQIASTPGGGSSPAFVQLNVSNNLAWETH